MSVDEIRTLLNAKFPVSEFKLDLGCTPHAIVVERERLFDVCEILRQHPSTYFDMLSCITGVDNGVAANTIDVIYNLYSIPFDFHLMLKVSLPRENPEVETVSGIWKTANWHEREAFDLLGIYFKNHPDLRRILLPADWQGHPLRKDYQHQEYYRDVKVAY